MLVSREWLNDMTCEVRHTHTHTSRHIRVKTHATFDMWTVNSSRTQLLHDIDMGWLHVRFFLSLTHMSWFSHSDMPRDRRRNSFVSKCYVCLSFTIQCTTHCRDTSINNPVEGTEAVVNQSQTRLWVEVQLTCAPIFVLPLNHCTTLSHSISLVGSLVSSSSLLSSLFPFSRPRWSQLSIRLSFPLSVVDHSHHFCNCIPFEI